MGLATLLKVQMCWLKKCNSTEFNQILLKHRTKSYIFLIHCKIYSSVYIRTQKYTKATHTRVNLTVYSLEVEVTFNLYTVRFTLAWLVCIRTQKLLIKCWWNWSLLRFLLLKSSCGSFNGEKIVLLSIQNEQFDQKSWHVVNHQTFW